MLFHKKFQVYFCSPNFVIPDYVTACARIHFVHLAKMFLTLWVTTAGCVASPTTAKVIDNQMESEVAMGYTMTQICDRFIEFFMHEKPETKDWRKILVFREEWQRYRPHFYKRCQVRIDVETDTSVKQKLIVLARKVKKVCSFFNTAKLVLFFARAKIVFMTGLNYEPTMFSFDLCMYPCQFKPVLKNIIFLEIIV